jgi:hypothetical protein
MIESDSDFCRVNKIYRKGKVRIFRISHEPLNEKIKYLPQNIAHGKVWMNGWIMDK